MCEQRARFAQELMRHFAIIAADDAGEDKAGRQKVRLMSTAEVVQRSCDISQAAFAEFKARGWMLEIPDPKPPTPPSRTST